MSLLQQLVSVFAPRPDPLPPGEYALRWHDHYFSTMHDGQAQLSPDPAMACRMSLEQAHFRRDTDKQFKGFEIVLMPKVRP